MSCIGEAGCNPVATWWVQSRSSKRPLDDPKFCPGEDVRICVNFLYDSSASGNWFHGLIPDFGPSWDMSTFDPDAVSMNISNAVWHDEKNELCAPRITEQMPYLCTYIDPLTGVLKLCNTACQICPCTGPLLSGSPLPGGWFWSNKGGPGCSNDCSPASKYGIGTSNISISMCLNLKVKKFDTSLDCIEQRSLHFNFQTTSDGVTGCWNDPIAECKLDYAQIGPNWEVDCSTSPVITGNNDEICGRGITQIDLTNSDSDTLVVIDVKVLPNPKVTGEKKHYFESGKGTITDTLINNSDTIQIITYIAQSKIPGFLCTSESDTFRVIVYPEIKVFFDPVVLCSDTISSVNLNPVVTGGTGNYIGTTTPFTPGYFWSTGETSQNIEVPTTISANYIVTVCDDKGCCASNEIRVITANENLVEANIFYSAPTCDIITVDISIDDSKIDTLAGVVFRLLDCEGNLVMNDGRPFIITGMTGVFDNVNYTENNCFILETSREGCITVSDTLRIECINAVKDQTSDFVTIIPNPTSGIITLKKVGTQIISAVKIFNLLGAEIFIRQDLPHQVDISFVPEGVYILSIEFDDGKKTGHRIIKIR